ncbi:MAG: autotransporter-associated beta strand repeat-containing protein, partial [Thermoguttaceae bacterium]
MRRARAHHLRLVGNPSRYSGRRSPTKLGTGTLLLSGNNRYLGATIVSAGTLVVANGNSIPDGTSMAVGADTVLIVDPSGATGSAVASSRTLAASSVPEPGTLALLD